MSGPTLLTVDFTKNFNETVARFKNDAVLVGIPAGDTTRDSDDDGESSPITNATLLAINEFGSPANNIPARPVMSIGIRAARDAIAEQFKKAAQNAWSMGVNALSIYYERAGIIASSSVKATINGQIGIEPPSKSTLRSRKRRGFKGTKALVVTGQMRNAITYVLNMGGL